MLRLCLSPAQNQEACIRAYIVVPNNTRESKIHERNNRRVSYSEPTMKSRKSTTAKVSAETPVIICECFQKGAAFKFRGASNVVLSLDNQQAANGVVTHSSGNHVAALSLAAQSRGIPAYIVVPNNAPKCKVRNIKRYGGHVSYSKPTIESRMSTAADVSEIKVVAIAAKAIKLIKVVAAEPIGGNDAALSKANDILTTIPKNNMIVDGLGASLGDLTWPILRDFVARSSPWRTAT